MKYTIITVLIIIFSQLTGYSQVQDKDRSFYYEFGKDVYLENFVWPNDNPDSLDVILIFRLRYNILTFAKVKDKPDSYYAVPKISVDYRGKDGIIRYRSVWTDTVEIETYDKTKSKKDYIFGYMIKTLHKDQFKLTFELENISGKVVYRQKLDRLPDYDYHNQSISSKPIFAYEEIDKYFDEGTKYYPFVLDGDLKFSSNSSKMLVMVSYQKKYDSYDYSLVHKPIGPDSPWEKDMNILGQATVVKNARLEIIDKGLFDRFYIAINKGAGYKGSDKYNIGFLDIDLPAQYLVPGKYEMKISPVGIDDTTVYSFKVEWVDMPFSLRNPEYAAELMKYILTDEEYDEISDGSKSEILNKIWKYWQKHDPTKFTPYNEAMAEYFTRVDDASFNYRGIGVKDGAKTERGKIYILNGKPDSVERTLENGKRKEEWKYEQLKQVYYFETNPAGRYILKEIKDI